MESTNRVIHKVFNALVIMSVVLVMSCSFSGLVHNDNCLCNTCEDQFNAEHELDVIEGNQR